MYVAEMSAGGCWSTAFRPLSSKGLIWFNGSVIDMDYLAVSEENARPAFAIIREPGGVEAWTSVGAKANLVGPLRMGLMGNLLYIDIHVYTPQLDVWAAYKAMGEIASNKRIVQGFVCKSGRHR